MINDLFIPREHCNKLQLLSLSCVNRVEFRFFEPPGEKEIGSNNRGVRKIGGKITVFDWSRNRNSTVIYSLIDYAYSNSIILNFPLFQT